MGAGVVGWPGWGGVGGGSIGVGRGGRVGGRVGAGVGVGVSKLSYSPLTCRDSVTQFGSTFRIPPRDFAASLNLASLVMAEGEIDS